MLVLIRSMAMTLIMMMASYCFAEELKIELNGDTLSINGGVTRLGVNQWNDPDKSWRTVGELMKGAVSPADPNGKRPQVKLFVTADDKVPWGAAKSVFMAASALGIGAAHFKQGEQQHSLSLPGANPEEGQVVKFPLFTGPQTENGGKRMPATEQVIGGMVKQLPKATINVQAENLMPATQVVQVLNLLKKANAAQIAYLPVKQITPEEMASQQEAKDAVERAFSGLGGLSK